MFGDLPKSIPTPGQAIVQRGDLFFDRDVSIGRSEAYSETSSIDCRMCAARKLCMSLGNVYTMQMYRPKSSIPEYDDRGRVSRV